MEHLLGLPPDASAHGPALDHLTIYIHYLMFALFVGWTIYYIYVLVRFRKGRNPQANYGGAKTKFVIYLAGFVAVLEGWDLGTSSIPNWSKHVSQHPDEKDATVVRVVGEQFAWNFHYPGPDGKFGKTDIKLVDSENPLGLDRSDPDAKDDIVTLNQLYLPVNKPVLIYLSSKDVIHSFSIPYMRVKQDAIPGEKIPVSFTPVKTSVEVREEVVTPTSIAPQSVPLDKAAGMTAMKDYKAKDGAMIIKGGEMILDTVISQLRIMGINDIMVSADLSGRVAMAEYNEKDGASILKRGDLVGDEAVQKLLALGITSIQTAPEVPMEVACAQLCGLGHYRMRGYLYVETQEEFNNWITQQEATLAENYPPPASVDSSISAQQTPSDSTSTTGTVR
jgi:cytochrome c oxidase subunit II